MPFPPQNSTKHQPQIPMADDVAPHPPPPWMAQWIAIAQSQAVGAGLAQSQAVGAGSTTAVFIGDGDENDGFTPIHTAVWGDFFDVVRRLLEEGADVSETGAHGSLLHVAASAWMGAPINGSNYLGPPDQDSLAPPGGGRRARPRRSRDPRKRDPRGREVVALLLHHGVDVSVKDTRGWTALHQAAYNGNAGVVSVLLPHTDVLTETNYGETAEYLASLNTKKPTAPHHQVVAILKVERIRAMCVAFAMGLDDRLGAGSLLATFRPELLKMVLQHVE